MKKYLLVLILPFLLNACDDDDDKNPSPSAKVNEVKTTTANGQWVVHYYFENGNEETDVFNGYVFDFNNDNTVMVSTGAEEFNGTWTVTEDGSGDDNSNDNYDDIDFNLSFSSNAQLQELTEDWEIVSLSDQKIELRHISGGGGGTDFLTFQKI